LTDESVCPTLLSKDLQPCGAGASACQPISSQLPAPVSPKSHAIAAGGDSLRVHKLAVGRRKRLPLEFLHFPAKFPAFRALYSGAALSPAPRVRTFGTVSRVCSASYQGMALAVPHRSVLYQGTALAVPVSQGKELGFSTW
jgi:hypothetical protein